MKTKPKTGLSGELRFTVQPEHLIDFAGPAMPAVLATPWLVKFLEQTARQTLQPCLEEGEISLGVSLDIQHLAPTPAGHTVVCLARVIQADGPQVTFQVEARDDLEPIARGLHTRAVVQVERFARRVARKRPGIDAAPVRP